VAFLELFWDAERGPWHEAYGANGEMRPMPLGDVSPRILRIEQVRVSANASANRKPMYWVIRESIPLAEAVSMYGEQVLEDISMEQTPEEIGSGKYTRHGLLMPGVDDGFREQEMVDSFRIYCEKSEYLPQGMTLIVIGRKVVFHGPLLCGRVPVMRMTDGSTDPAFYPRAIMEDWLDSQMRINAVLSKWVENVRLNAGPKMIGKEGSLVSETLTGTTMSFIAVRGMGGINELVQPLTGFSLAPDAEKLLGLEIKAFEDLSGWNDVSRGQIGTEQSGRAILAIREQLERIFAPPVSAAAEAIQEWGKISCAWMAFGFDEQRNLNVQGTGRPDLAVAVSAEDFDGVTDVWIDPETLMPMPRALRLFLLDDLFAKGLMSPVEYRRRLPFAWTRSLGSYDEDHEARAKRVVLALKQGQQLPILWQDDEAIHQDVLERELILPDDTDPMIREMALMRWTQLAEQSAMKMGMMGPGMPQPGGGSGPTGGGGAGTNPSKQPFQGSNPGTKAGTMSQLGGQADANQLAQSFDKRQPY
jgi:hypothetical protein